MDYRKEIDGLRAIAVIPVIFFHASFESFSGGFVGVDVFFVISGYLITTIILSEKQKGTFSIVNFYERRARRILPALFFVMFVSLPLAWILLVPSDLKDFSQSLISVSFFYSNILFWMESGYFDAAAEMKPLLHTWSLAVEEQYYVLFPLFLTLVWHYRKRWIFGAIIVLGFFSLLLAQWGAYNYPSATFYLLPTRAWELMAGAATAFYLLYGKSNEELIERNSFISELLGILGLSLIFLSIFLFDYTIPFPSLYAFIPILGVIFIILFSSQKTITGRVLGSRFLVGIGLISYSLYLWHQPLFVFVKHYNFGHPSNFVYSLLIILTFIFSYFSWRFVEKPFRAKNVISRKQVFAFSVFGSIIFIVAGVLGHITDGFYKQKISSKDRELLKTAISSPKREECHTRGDNYRKPKDACVYFDNNANWAVFGDSHTVELSYALAEYLKGFNSIKHYSFSGCRPAFLNESLSTNCAQWTDEAVRFIANDVDIKTVVVSYRINAALFGGHESTYPVLPNENTNDQRIKIWKSYKDTINYLLNAGKNVIVVLQAPELRASIERLILREHYLDEKIVGVSKLWWDKRNAYVMDRIHEVPKRAHIIDPTEIFCGNEVCFASSKEISYYFDDDHMSVEGAKLVAKEIVNYVNSLEDSGL